MKKQTKILILLALMMLVVAGCAYHDQSAHASIANPYGFFYGLWHGIIFPFSLAGKIVSWLASFFDYSFLKEAEVIGEPNNGGPYFCGYALGVIIIFNIFD